MCTLCYPDLCSLSSELQPHFWLNKWSKNCFRSKKLEQVHTLLSPPPSLSSELQSHRSLTKSHQRKISHCSWPLTCILFPIPSLSLSLSVCREWYFRVENRRKRREECRSLAVLDTEPSVSWDGKKKEANPIRKTTDLQVLRNAREGAMRRRPSKKQKDNVRRRKS